MKKTHLITAILCSFIANSLHAETITFESGYSEFQQISSIATATNMISLATDASGPFIAMAGDPLVAFGTIYGSDTVRPDLAASVGSYFLSDENTGGTNIPGTFEFVFANPVENLSMILLDLDGGNFATLTTFSTTTFSGQNSSQTINGTEDGITDLLSVQIPSSSILSARLTTSDIGLAIDNITFETVPEPTSIALALLLIGMISLPRKLAH